MLPYLTLLAVVFTLSYFVQTQQRVSIRNLNRNAHTQEGRWVLVIMTGILVLFAGLRRYVGSDYGIYEWLFGVYMETPIWETIFVEEGFFWSISSIIGFFTKDTQFVFIAASAITTIIMVKFISKYAINFSLSIFLYLTMMMYFSAFNGVRQWFAAAILIAGFPLLLEKKKWRYCLLVLFAYYFHNSAIVVLPFVFIVYWKPRSGKTYLLYLTIFAFFFLFPGITNTIFEWIAPENYKKYFDNAGDDGVNIIRVAVYALPVILTRIFYDRLAEREDEKPLIDLLINLSTINFMIILLGTRNTTLARIGMYFSIYNVLLIPYLLRVFKEESRLTAKVIIMACFFLYMYMLLPVESYLVPYKSVFDF